MKTVIAAIMIAFAFAQIANAQSYNSSNVGNFTYYNGDDGYQGTESRVGNFSYYNDNRGNNCTTSRVGNQTYTNCY